MDFSKFIVDQALILIPVLYIIGLMLKNLKSIPDKYIPLILLVVGVGMSLALIGINAQAIIQGVLVTGVAVFTNQLIKQLSSTDNSQQ
jgi:hypothetical protein